MIHRYMLVTMAETPHDDRITCLKLRPKPEMSAYKEMAITAGSTGKFKCWVLEENEYEGIFRLLFIANYLLQIRSSQ